MPPWIDSEVRANLDQWFLLIHLPSARRFDYWGGLLYSLVAALSALFALPRRSLSKLIRLADVFSVFKPWKRVRVRRLMVFKDIFGRSVAQTRDIDEKKALKE